MVFTSIRDWSVLTLLICVAPTANAGKFPYWPYERLFRESNLVVIAEAEKNETSTDTFPDKNPWRVGMEGIVMATADLVGEQEESRETKAMRQKIIDGLFVAEENSRAVANAYKTLFMHLGLDRVKKLIDDQDTSIALQAAWETHRKTVKRQAAVLGRTDWVFDKKLIEAFLGIFAKRVKADPPDWWRTTLLEGQVFPGRHHAFEQVKEGLPAAPKVKVEKDEVIITTGTQTIKLLESVYDDLSSSGDPEDAPVVLCGAEQSFLARPWDRGYPFTVIGLDSKTGMRLWTALVWAARRGQSTGPRSKISVEIRRQGDTVIVYGRDSHGLYAEGFHAKTGKCQFRFCTCYWFNFSEEWGLK